MKLVPLFLIALVLVLSVRYSQTEVAKTHYFTTQTSLQDSALQKSIKRGLVIYKDFCIQCHLPEGTGVAGIYPPLAQSDFLSNTPTAAIRAVKYGLKGKIYVNGKKYNNTMPSPGLYDDEVADVMNYIRNSWGNKHATMLTEQEVAALEN